MKCGERVSEENKYALWDIVTLFFVVTIGLLVFYLFLYAEFKRAEIILSVLLVISVIALTVSLTFTAFIFKHLGLSDRKQSLGLPEGSVRAVIALSLILIFMISSLLLFEEVRVLPTSQYRSITQELLNDIPKEQIAYIQQVSVLINGTNETRYNVGRIMENSKASEDLAKQIITTVSTLVVAVSSFYFASKTVAAAAGTPAVSVPVLRSTSPAEGKRKEEIKFRVCGKNLELAKNVKLIRDSLEIACTGVTSSSTKIKCTLKIPEQKEYPEGKWTVVVINSDKGEDRLEGAFTILPAAGA
ncbi:MAG: hypothetical protein APR53_04205 [Methanoculleus sp. SDB]|nr:MAG: hypothetical protein APR53_04205 [Methanoculleus sp. SDB]